jgi:hypothetical protein
MKIPTDTILPFPRKGKIVTAIPNILALGDLAIFVFETIYF